MYVIDRRPNPHGKNLENRQRVFDRARGAMLRATREAVVSGKLREVGHGEAVSVPAETLHEPSFHTVFNGGARDLVLSGNKQFSTGDRLRRQPQEEGARLGPG